MDSVFTPKKPTVHTESIYWYRVSDHGNNVCPQITACTCHKGRCIWSFLTCQFFLWEAETQLSSCETISNDISDPPGPYSVFTVKWKETVPLRDIIHSVWKSQPYRLVIRGMNFGFYSMWDGKILVVGLRGKEMGVKQRKWYFPEISNGLDFHFELITWCAEKDLLGTREKAGGRPVRRVLRQTKVAPSWWEVFKFGTNCISRN